MSKGITGISVILGSGIFHAGAYKRGIWFDNNEKLKLPKEKRTGWGFKIDLCFGRTIRPIGLLWDRSYWDNEKTSIESIPEDLWDDYFGEELADKIRKLSKDRLHYGVCNPWYAKKWFVLRQPAWIPTAFISFGFGKLWSFYIGNKAYSIDPYTSQSLIHQVSVSDSWTEHDSAKR